MARNRTAPAEALRDGPAARVADAQDREWYILRDACGLRVALLLPNDLPLDKTDSGRSLAYSAFSSPQFGVRSCAPAPCPLSASEGEGAA